MEKNIMRGALRAGAKLVQAEAKAQLASHGNMKTGVLADGLKISTRSKGGKVIASVKAKGKHGYIARWIEFTGAAPHVIKGKNGKALAFAGGLYTYVLHPGMKAKPFMRPAMDSKAGAAVVAVGEAIKKRLTKQGIDTPDVEINEA